MLVEVIYGVGGNWLESYFSWFGGKYVGVVLVEIDLEWFFVLEDVICMVDIGGLYVLVLLVGEVVVFVGEMLCIELVG